jgi:hypothetical protein
MAWLSGAWRVHARTAALVAWATGLAACAGGALGPSASGVQHAWVQANEQGQWQARAITSGPCPVVQWRGGERSMATRAEPAVLAARPDAQQADAKPAVFALRACAADLPPAAQAVHIGDLRLPSPPGVIRRIVLLGDTGCRLKRSDDAFQDCGDPMRWPFASVAAQAAQARADLVIHLGDIHYRESPCPDERSGCSGSPWGYGHDTWAADFFRPAAPLLAAAPWVIVRGNHETCARAGAGWFRYLDPRPPEAALTCANPTDDARADHTTPYAVALSVDTQLIVFDSSAVSGKPYRAADAAFQRYTRDLAEVARLAALKPHNIFLNHHPVLAFGGSASGSPKPGTAGLLSVLQTAYPETLFPPGVDLVINGHVHLFEALGFASGHPAEWLTGNGGSAMEGHVDRNAALQAEPAPRAHVQTFATQAGFGYSTLELGASGWQLSEFNVRGDRLARCSVQGHALRCDAAPAE